MSRAVGGPVSLPHDATRYQPQMPSQLFHAKRQRHTRPIP